MNRRSIATIVICLISAMLLAGCSGSSGSSSKDKAETVSEGTGPESAEDAEKTKQEKKEDNASDEEETKTDVSADQDSSEGSGEDESDYEPDDANTASTLKDQEPFFGLWVAAFKERSDAEALVEKLKEKGLHASYVYSCDWENLNKDPNYCVTIGRSGSEPEAQAHIDDAAKAGYPDAYVKDTGDRLGHRVNYTVFDESKIDISPSKAVLKDVMVDDLSGDESGDATLIVDKDTVFDESCDMQFFSYYQDGQSPLEWFNHINEIKDTEEYQAQTGALMGVFEVDITGDHVNRFYGSYWWD